jgi:hypothetical protein
MLTLNFAFFVVRTKAKILLQRRYSHKIDKSTGVRSDHTVILTSFESASVYLFTRMCSAASLFLDVEKKKRFKFFTNNFTLPLSRLISKRQVRAWGSHKCAPAEHPQDGP